MRPVTSGLKMLCQTSKVDQKWDILLLVIKHQSLQMYVQIFSKLEKWSLRQLRLIIVTYIFCNLLIVIISKTKEVDYMLTIKTKYNRNDLKYFLPWGDASITAFTESGFTSASVSFILLCYVITSKLSPGKL